MKKTNKSEEYTFIIIMTLGRSINILRKEPSPLITPSFLLLLQIVVFSVLNNEVIIVQVLIRSVFTLQIPTDDSTVRSFTNGVSSPLPN